MKANRIPISISALLAIAVLTPTLRAEENHGQNHGHKHTEETVKVSLPETLEDLWSAIKLEHAVLLAAVEKKDDHATHDAEEKLQVYLKALPEKIISLAPTAQKRIEGQAKNLARVYDSIHHAADDLAWEKASADLKKAEGALTLLAAQLPH